MGTGPPARSRSPETRPARPSRFKAGDTFQSTYGAVQGFRFVEATLTGAVEGANQYGVPTLSTPDDAYHWTSESGLALSPPGRSTGTWTEPSSSPTASKTRTMWITSGRRPSMRGCIYQANVSVTYNDGSTSPAIDAALPSFPSSRTDGSGQPSPDRRRWEPPCTHPSRPISVSPSEPSNGPETARPSRGR